MSTWNWSATGGRKTSRLHLVAASLLALAILGAAMVEAARADVGVRARVRTKHVDVTFHGGPRHMPPAVVRNHGPRPHPIVVKPAPHRRWQRHFVHPINQRDRLVAKRMARLTGYNQRQLLRMRRDGYSWYAIGQYLDVAPMVVRASMNERAYWRYVRRHREPTICWSYDGD